MKKTLFLACLLAAASAAELENSEFEPAVEFCGTPEAPFECQAFDASNNNEDNPGFGCPDRNLIRTTFADYVLDPIAGGMTFPAGLVPGNRCTDCPVFNARQVSNEVHRVRDEGDPANARGLTDFVTIFGQFLDHDFALTPGLEELVGNETQLEIAMGCRPSVFCGDGICGPLEDPMNCQVDCNGCQATQGGLTITTTCGNGMCDEEFCINNDNECACLADCAPEATQNFVSIPVLSGDPFFDPNFDGDFVIILRRGVFDVATLAAGPLEQVNLITSFIDASTVYGSDALRGSLLRSFKDGELRVSESEFGELMPLNGQGGVFLTNDNNAREPEDLFVGGDLRVNEQPTLMGIHTLWVREHNWHARRLASFLPENTGDEVIFQMARRYVTAEIQKITFLDWLPALAGDNPLPNYRGYNSSVNVDVSNEFQHGVYRLGHSLINPWIQRVNSDGSPNGAGAVSLGENFFRPESLLVADTTGEGGLDVVWRGMASQNARELDTAVTDALRNMLFGPPLNDDPMDLAAINIQRARDHGIPSYADVRSSLGLSPRERFSDISADDETALDLFTAYDGQLEAIDIWPGALAEDHIRGSLGETAFTVIIDQFQRARDGDRFYFAADGVLSNSQMLNVLDTTLADVILRNSNIECLQDNVFFSDGTFDFATCSHI